MNLLACSSALALSSANSQVGKVTRLMTKDLPDVPGKEGMIETVDFAPGEVSQPHRHNADLFVYVLNRTTRHWDTSSGTTVQAVMLSAAKHLAVETLRCAQGDMIGVPIFCGLI